MYTNHTYKKPLQNLRKIKIPECVTTLPMILITALIKSVIYTTFFRPLVSAKYPQMCELATTPRKPTDDRSPFSVKVRFKSHCAAGTINIAHIVSMMTLMRLPPVAIKENKLNFPKPEIIYYNYIC